MSIWQVWVCLMMAAVIGASTAQGGESTLESADLAWLLVQESPAAQPQSGAQVSVRRITPKSVFLAPTFTSCSEGYRQDSLGRCVKIVKVNPSAQWDFFLHKLNTMYGPPEPNNKPNPGPFRLPIPIGTEAPTTSKATTTTTTTTTTTELPTTSSTVTEEQTSTTLQSTTTTTTEEQPTEPPFLIVVANTTEQSSTITEQTSTPISTIITEPSTTEISTECEDCADETSATPPITTITTPNPTIAQQPSRTTIIFPEDTRKRPSSVVRFPEAAISSQQQQQQQTPYWWPHSWEQRLWQPQSSYYAPPRHHSYHGHREGRPAWQH